MDLLAALRLQFAWGADEALLDHPVDRLRPAPQPPQPRAASPPVPAAPPMPVAGAELVARARQAAEAAGSVAELRAALARFDAFGLAATATSMVFADGNPRARLVLVGDAPGAEEDASGVAFSGPAGRLLDRMLASIGLDRTQVLLTTVIPWRPPGGRPPSEAEIAGCLPFLHRHLALLRPRHIVVLGAVAARALLMRRDPISRLRGRWTEIAVPGLEATVPALPMLQPTQLMARPELKAHAWADLRLLRRTLDKLTES